MSVKVSVVVHRDRIQAALRDPAGPPAQFTRARCVTAVAFAKASCPVDGGRLRNSITYRVSAEATRIVGSVFTNVKYARFQHEGTGIYGPRRAFIYPKRGNFLVFETKGVHGPLRRGKKRPAKGRRNLVFARRVRGVQPSPFLVRGLELAMPGVPIRHY